MRLERPQLRLTFAGEGFREGAVPLTILALKLQALQLAVFHAAATASKHREQRRGMWYNRYRSVAELTFSKAHHSDLVIEAELATDPVLHEDFDVGLQAIDLLFQVAGAIQRDNMQSIQLSRSDRDYLLRAVEGLMPNTGDQYEIRLENCRPEQHPSITFTAEMRQRLREYSVADDQPFPAEEIALVGELIKIHVDAGEDKITIRWQQREIDCFYGDALRDQIANLIAGSMVEITGLATLNDRGDVSRIYQITNVEHVSMEPLRIARFEHAGKLYNLNKPIAVNVEYNDGFWVYHYSDLNLWGYAPRREDALKELNENFAYLYREFVEDSEANLDAVAQRLRRRLLDLTAPQSREAAHA